MWFLPKLKKVKNTFFPTGYTSNAHAHNTTKQLLLQLNPECSSSPPKHSITSPSSVILCIRLLSFSSTPILNPSAARTIWLKLPSISTVRSCQWKNAFCWYHSWFNCYKADNLLFRGWGGISVSDFSIQNALSGMFPLLMSFIKWLPCQIAPTHDWPYNSTVRLIRLTSLPEVQLHRSKRQENNH